MSTNACIAKGTPDNWEGVYVHWDGYPEGLGRDLIANYIAIGSDLDLLIKESIDNHPTGWSSYPDKAYDVEGEPEMIITSEDDEGGLYVYILTGEGIYVGIVAVSNNFILVEWDQMEKMKDDMFERVKT